MKIANWEQLPTEFTFDYDQQQLQDNWLQIHAGDQYPYPLNTENADNQNQQQEVLAWLHYHNGNYQKAAEIGASLNELGAIVLAKSVAAYCDYLCEDEDHVLILLSECINLCEQAVEEFPDCGNNHFVIALLMGRYSQRISITKALSQGLGGKIRKYLENTLEMEPNHAEAHTAMGLYHAEIIDKIGAMIGGLTYGAKKPIAMKHFATSLELTPDAPITSIEYANGIMLLGGDENRFVELHQQASQCTALDALQNCDISFAQDQLEE